MAEKIHNSKVKDSSSKIIFEDPVLCAQFLRAYIDIPLLRDVQPEDIEDVTERFIPMFTEERNADTVKKIHVGNDDLPFFLISIIEHKSQVDYNVVMQILRYMVFVWEDYEKEMEKKQNGISRTEGFRYPPILPVIFYDGTVKWTVPKRLKERVFLNEAFEEYIPDYQCILADLNDYSNAELMEQGDAFSLLALLDKLQNAEEYTGLERELSGAYLANVLAQTPEYLLKLIAQVTGVFLRRLNVPEEEVEDFKEKIRGRGMNGELFTRLQAWDVQALRKEVREEARKEAVEKMVKAIKDTTHSAKTAKEQLMRQYEMPEEEAEANVKLYW